MTGVSLAVEGRTDIPVAARLVRLAGGEPLPGPIAGGKSRLDPLIPALNRTAAGRNWLVLRDLDHDAGCAAALVRDLVGMAGRAPRLSLRIPVRGLEAWLLADAVGFSQGFRVARKWLPADPDLLEDPKRRLVEVCRRSVRSRVRRAMIPRPRSGRTVGPEYSSRIIAFTEDRWDPERAAVRSPSLARSIRALRLLVDEGIWS